MKRREPQLASQPFHSPGHALHRPALPGPAWTPLVAATTDPESLSEFGSSSGLGRPAQPAELAGAFVFPASPAATYITGAVIAVTGGEFYA